MSTFWQDLRYGVRGLVRSPGFAIAAILTLALGIGANTAIFQLLEAVRLRSLPVADPERLAEIRIADMEGVRGSFSLWHAGVTDPVWERIRERQQAFSGVFAWSAGRLSLASAGEPRFASAILASGRFFEVLGVRPLLGRLLREADDQKGCSDPAVVLSHAFWQREYGGDPTLVGRRVSLGRYSYEVVGVTPASFTGLEVGKRFDVAVPLCAEALPPGRRSRLDSGTDWWLVVMGRLKPGWTLERANVDLRAISPGVFEVSLPANYPRENVKQYLAFRLEASQAASGISLLRDQYTESLLFLQATAGLVLLVGCANLANLMLARATARERELAARVALGAGRGRLVLLLLSESLALAGVGAAAGAWLADGLSRYLLSTIESQPGSLFLDISLDWRVFGFSTAAGILTCALFGLTPALRAARVSPGAILRTVARGSTEGRARLGMRRLLVVGQVGLSLVLVVGASVSARSLQNLLGQDTGLQTKRLLIAYVDMSALQLSGERWLNAKSELHAQLRAVPGVLSVAETNVVPLSQTSWSNAVWLEGRDPARRTDANFARASARYFETLGVPLLAGRAFDERDTLHSPGVAIVNQALARELAGGASPLGRRFWREATPSEPEQLYEIVGLVRDTKYQDLRKAMPPIAYLATTQEPRPQGFAQLLIRTAGAPKAMVSVLRGAISKADPGIVASFADYQDMLEESLVRDRVVAMLSGFFGLLALLLATLGLYGVMAFVVSRRTSEIGIRMALGAERGAILRMVLGEATALVGLGLVAGCALALGLARTVRTLVYGLEPSDPLALGLSCLLLGSVGLVASLVPARRAAGLDPMTALRCE